MPYYFKIEILGPNSFIGHLFKSKKIKELSSYICINNSEILYVDKSVFPLGCRLIKIFEKKFNYSLMKNIIKKFAIFENININYLTKNYSNYFMKINIKKGEKLIIQGTPQEGIYFICKVEFQLRTMKSYYDLQDLIFSLRNSLDKFKDYISSIKYRESNESNNIKNKSSKMKYNIILQNSLFMKKAKEKKEIILSTYNAPTIAGLNEFYDNKTGIYHFSLYCQSEDAEVYFLHNKLFNNLLANDDVYKNIKNIVHIIEEKVKFLIFLIKRYKSLYEAEFVKYISLNKSINNENCEISNKKIFKNSFLQNSHEAKNDSEENHLKKHKIFPIKIKTDIIKQPKYNIIKKKLFHCPRKQNNRLEINSTKENSLNIPCGTILKRNKITSLKHYNKSVSYFPKNEIIKNLNLSLLQKESPKKGKKILKVESHFNVRKNLFKLINMNISQDNNFGYGRDSERYYDDNKNLNNSLINSTKREKYRKIRLKSLPNIKLNNINEKSLIKDNSKIEKLINIFKNENNIYNIKKKDNNIINNELNKKNTSLNSLENINNKNNFNHDKKKLNMINGKRIVLRNNFDNNMDINNSNNRYSINPLKSLNF